MQNREREEIKMKTTLLPTSISFPTALNLNIRYTEPRTGEIQIQKYGILGIFVFLEHSQEKSKKP